MSTRSGKRIHPSVDSPTVNVDIIIQSERKTRSKKQKENVEFCVQKKHNYVSYPGDEEASSVFSDAAETQEKARKTGKTPKSILKECNAHVPVSDNEVLNHENRSIRKTHRSRKMVEESEHPEEIGSIQSHDTAEINESGKKIIKKKKKHVIKKKGIKKKKKVISDQESAQIDTCIDNTSVDSFHSAAGSPIKVILTENDNQSESVTNFVEQVVDDNIFMSVNIPAASKTAGAETKTKRKSIIKNSALDKVDMDDISKTKINASFDNSHDVTIDSNFTGELATKKKKKSSIKNSTFNKNDETENKLNTPVGKTSNVQKAFFNNTINLSTQKTRKSSIKNSTFEIEDKLNTTVNKTIDVSKDFSNSSLTDVSAQKARKSSIKNSTFEIEDKLNTTVNKTNDVSKDFSNSSLNDVSSLRTRKSSIKNSTFDKIGVKDVVEDNLNTDVDHTIGISTPFNASADVSLRKRKKSNTSRSTIDNNETNYIGKGNLNKTFDEIHDKSTNLNTTADLFPSKAKRCRIQNSTFDKIETEIADNDNLNSTFNYTVSVNTLSNCKLSNNNDKFHKTVPPNTEKLNNTYNSESVLNSTDHTTGNRKRKTSVKNSTFDKLEKHLEDNDRRDATNMLQTKRPSQMNGFSNELASVLNNTVETASASKTHGKTTKLDSTFDTDTNIELNTTCEPKNKSLTVCDYKNSTINNSDANINVTFDKSGSTARISITSDESGTENILNHTPVLIESSIDASLISEDKTPEKLEVPVTPLKREGTFTKEVSDIVASPKPKASADKTPVKRKSSPVCTPYPYSKSSQKENTKLNITRSIEKSLRRSSLVEQRQTKVMFCSPVDNPAMVSQVKGRVIKSNLKGSNKSFVFEDNVPSEARACRRKRSFTASAAGEAETRAKRKRLADELQHSVDRLSRPRTQSAAAKLPEPGTPSKKLGTPSKAKPESRVSRTKLPNFAALHQKQFAKMESLDECQERKARRARQLLTPTGSVGLLERISPKGTPPKPAVPTKEPATKLHTPSKPKLPTLDTLIPGYTRFGFKLNVEANPFSVIRKPEPRKGNALSRQTTCLALPSLAGVTATRREAAKQTVMREKSFTERRDLKRKETRTVIKGVRTNRRFELQMRHRAVNA